MTREFYISMTNVSICIYSKMCFIIKLFVTLKNYLISGVYTVVMGSTNLALRKKKKNKSFVKRRNK